MQQIINVSNRLPIKIGKTIEKSSGGLVSAFEDVCQHYQMPWMGWPGAEVPVDEQEVLCTRLEEYSCYPVFLSKEEEDAYYHRFSNACLWPLLHYFTSYASYSHDDFVVYRQVNERFAKTIACMAEEGALVWVHDYHLMLLPSMLRKRRPDLNIGFFLHTPFPSYEIFRCLPQRKELLEGLMGADLIGFHTFGYLRHFRSAILRVLGVDSEMDHTSYKNRSIAMGVFPIGISWSHMEKVLQSDACSRFLFQYKQHYKGRKVVLSVERLDYTKGIPQKLDVIEQYLESNPLMREQVVFVQVAIPSRQEVEWNKKIEEEVVQKVSYINGKYSTINNIPVQFMFKTLPLDELCALYALADVALVTSLVDGMNLVAKEYIACQKDNAGSLILSEFAGAAEELFAATQVNPYDQEAVLLALTESLAFTQRRNASTLSIMRDQVIQHDSAHWAQSFINRLREPRSKTLSVAINCIPKEKKDKLKESSHVLLFLDYDGTLRAFEESPQMAFPGEDLLALLRFICEKKGLDLYIISGRSQQDLAAWLEHLPCGLIAEHGYVWKNLNQSEWTLFHQDIDLEWKNELAHVFQFYSSSTPGSFVESKKTSLVWHYRRSDPEFGAWKARLLTGELYEMTANMPVEVRHGHKIIEVCSQYINKGEALKWVLKKHYNVALCVGDDLTDEHMFQVNDPRLVTAKVGLGQTSAQNRFESPQAFLMFLEQLVGFKDKGV